MKKLLLFLIACMFISTYVNANAPQKRNFEQTKVSIKKESNVVVRDRNYYTEHQRSTNDLKAKAEKKKDNNEFLFSTTLQNFSGLDGFTKARNVNELITKYQLDSVHSVNEYGENIWLVKLTYDENYLPKKQENWLWDEFSQRYMLLEEFNFAWYPNGYLQMENVIFYDEEWGNMGLQYSYTYNAQNLCASRIGSSLMESGEWMPSDKVDFKYDERGNPIEAISFSYFMDDDVWNYEGKELADYDSFNRQIKYEGYYWEGVSMQNGTWIGFAKDEREWLPSGEFIIVLWYEYEWDYDNSEWVYFGKLDQGWNDRIQLTLQAFSFWNAEREDWSGEVDIDGWILYNNKAILEYDDEGKQTYELASELRGGSWFSTFEFEFDWDTHTPTGELQLNMNGNLYDEDGIAKNHVIDYLVRYSSYFPPFFAITTGKFTHQIESHNWFGEGWEYLYETAYEYDNQGRQVKESFWFFEDGEKFADISETLTYDANSNIIKSVYHIGQYTGPDDWVLSSTFDYEYDQFNYEIRRYRFAGEDLTLDWGYGVDFDYDVPASLVISFPGSENDPFKIFYLYDFIGNGTSWDEQISTFYYSEKQVGIKEVVNNNKVTIYPNPTTNTITIKTDDDFVQVLIYNMLGMKMLQTAHKNIDLSSFAPGVYVVDVNGIKTKVVKK